MSEVSEMREIRESWHVKEAGGVCDCTYGLRASHQGDQKKGKARNPKP